MIGIAFIFLRIICKLFFFFNYSHTKSVALLHRQFLSFKFLSQKLREVDHFLVNAASSSYQQTSPKKPSSFFDSMSEIASCSYEARAVGVRNGMFLGAARKLCPDIYCVPYQFEQYRQVSQRLYDILVTYSHEIEAVSCDEAYIDVSETLEGIYIICYVFYSGFSRLVREHGAQVRFSLATNVNAPFFRVLTPEFGNSARALVQGLDFVLGH